MISLWEEELAFELRREWRVGTCSAKIWEKSISGRELADAKALRWEWIWCVDTEEHYGWSLEKKGEIGQGKCKDKGFVDYGKSLDFIGM